MYHLHHQNQTEDILFWLEQAGGSTGPILELGCGTGRVLLPLKNAGYRVIGIDKNLARLRFFQDHLEANYMSQVDLIQADFSSFRFSIEFGLILLTCNTLSTLGGDMRRKVFSRINEHLAEDGRFVASVPNPGVLSKLPDLGESELEETLVHPESGNPLQVSSEWEMFAGDKIIFRWHYDHLLPDGHVERLSIEISHTLASLTNYEADLQTAGLRIRSIYGDFNKTAFNDQSPFLIMSAEKIPRF